MVYTNGYCTEFIYVRKIDIFVTLKPHFDYKGHYGENVNKVRRLNNNQCNISYNQR